MESAQGGERWSIRSNRPERDVRPEGAIRFSRGGGCGDRRTETQLELRPVQVQDVKGDVDTEEGEPEHPPPPPYPAELPHRHLAGFPGRRRDNKHAGWAVVKAKKSQKVSPGPPELPGSFAGPEIEVPGGEISGVVREASRLSAFSPLRQ